MPTPLPTTPSPTPPANSTCPALLTGAYNDALIPFFVTLPFDGDLIVDARATTGFSLPIGVEVIVDGEIISDGDPEDAGSQNLLLRVERLPAAVYQVRFFVGHVQPAQPPQIGNYSLSIECVSSAPTANPSPVPTQEPSTNPTLHPTANPTVEPTANPSFEPTADPTENPTPFQSSDPTANPTTVPTLEPSADPSSDPTADPTLEPSSNPTKDAAHAQDGSSARRTPRGDHRGGGVGVAGGH